MYVRAPLIRPSLAFVAQPEHDQIVLGGQESVFFADSVLLIFQQFIVELDYLSALRADEMFMMLLSESVFKMYMTPPDVHLRDKTVLDEKVKRSVNSSAGDLFLLASKTEIDLVGVEMLR